MTKSTCNTGHGPITERRSQLRADIERQIDPSYPQTPANRALLILALSILELVELIKPEARS